MALYRVTYQPAAHVEALALKRGLKADLSNGGFWDYVNPDECVITVCQVADFALAAASAKHYAPLDACGCARIEEVVRVHWRGAPPTWETVAFWEVCEGDEPKADAPDVREELHTEPGDAVLA